jgi:hypothetical protein
MKKILLIGLVLALVGAMVAYKMYNKPHADMAQVKAEAKLSAKSLFEAFDVDENAANEKYLGKIIEVEGEINKVDKKDGKIVSLGLETGDMLAGLTCSLDDVDYNHRQDFAIGNVVTLRCKCTGKLMDIELNRCVEIRK